MKQNKPAEAESLFREALEIYHAALPVGHPLIANGLNNLAFVLNAQNKPYEAEPMFREALEIYRKGGKAQQANVVFTLAQLAGCLRGRDQHAEAEPLLREVLAGREEMFGPTDTRNCRTAYFLADTLEKLKRVDEAEGIRKKYRLGDPATRPATAPTTRP